MQSKGSVPAKAPPMHTTLRVLVSNDQVAIQPGGRAASNQLPTLGIELHSGRVQHSLQPLLGKGAQDVMALMGVFVMKGGAAVAVVTAAQEVAVLFGSPVFRVTKTRLIQPKGARFDAGDKRLLALLSDAIDPSGSGRNIFFSYGADLTLTAQARTEVVADPKRSGLAPCVRANPRYFWNRVLAQPVIDAGGAAFVNTMILGSVGQLKGIEAVAHGKGVILDITLVARRSTERIGTRHWRRGIDMQGRAANFVESEQLVSVDGGRMLCSYVQVRGSIPLLWTQIPNIKYKPPTKILDDEQQAATAFDAHMDALLAQYTAASCINLVNQHGSEGTLAHKFGGQVSRYRAAKRDAQLQYVAFDFHKECGAANYHRLSILWDAIAADFKSMGLYTQENGQVLSRQRGVFRTNCVDCLDRTNVVQGVLGRKALEAVLMSYGVLRQGEGLASVLPEVEVQYKCLWADHGDDISRQYAGTGALKSGFTRTGKRSVGGLVDDGMKSIVRYYLNNFADGSKQDALDLATGAYVVKPDVTLRFRAQHSPALPLLLALVAFVYALRSMTAALAGGLDGGIGALGLHVLVPLVLAAALVLMVGRAGRFLVNRPQLCPQLANTVAAAGAQAVETTGGVPSQMLQ